MQITNAQVDHINQQIEAFQTDVINGLGALKYQLNQLAGGTGGGDVSTPRSGGGTGRPVRRSGKSQTNAGNPMPSQRVRGRANRSSTVR